MDQQPSKLTDQNVFAEAASPGPEAQDGGAGERLTRRRFTRAGLAVPVILTLSNRPAFGAVCTVSGFASTNPSGVVRHGGDECGGSGPSHWKQLSDWGISGINQETLFDAVFGPGTLTDGTLQDVLEGSDSLASNAVAALLSAYVGGYSLAVADVIGLYRVGANIDSSFTTLSGWTVSYGDIDVQLFFTQTFN